MARKTLIITILIILTANLLGTATLTQAQAAYPIPPDVQSYALPGERIVALRPVSINRREYRTFYFVTGPSKDTEGDIFHLVTRDSWQQGGIQGILVMDGSRPLTDPALLRQVFLTILSGYMLTVLANVPEVITVDPGLIEQMHRLTDHPLYIAVFIGQQVKSLLKTREEQDAEALRAMLVARDQNAPRVTEFSEDVRSLVRTGNTIEDAIDQLIQVGKYSNYRHIREIAKEARKLFKGWEKYTEQGRDFFKIGGIKVEYINALDLISLGVQLVYLDKLSLERAEMLDRLAKGSVKNEPPLTPTLRTAIETVVAEARSTSRQREDILMRFVKEKAADVASQLGKKVLVDLWTKWAWDTFGKRTIGHLVAGAASQVLLGFTVSNLLFGMDAIFENTVIAQRAARMEEIFGNAAIWALLQRGRQSQAYDGELADIYRSTVLFKNLAAAQVYSSYADSIAGSRLLKKLADLVSGNEWTEAEKSFRNWADEAEVRIEELIGHPDIIDYAVDLALDRARRGPGIPVTATSTTLVFDVSGSMDWDDPSGKRKIKAARNAALLVTRMIRRENDQQGTAHEAGVVTFTDDARTLQPLTSEIADVEQAVARLEPQQGTNLAAGLIQGAQQLQSITTKDRRILILLSDGVPTVYLNGRGARDRSELITLEQEVLDEAVPQAASVSDCLYVVGFGDPNKIIDGWPSIDEDFLRRIAAATACGGYYIAETADELANLYVQLRHESTGTLVGTWSGTVAQGKTTPPIPIDVPPNQSELHTTLNWPGSGLDLLLTDPQRRTVDNAYPGATLFTDESPVYVIVRNPVAGTWQAQVYGADVPQGTTAYNLIASTRSAPVKPAPPAVGGSVWTPVRPGGLGPVIVLLTLLAGGAAALVVVAVSRRPMRPTPPWPPPPQPFGTLKVTAPGQPPRTVFLSRLPFTIGRRLGCDLVLSDLQVSRTHARISGQDGTFVLEDLNSTNGTMVNGQWIQRHVLRPGHEIQIGQTRLRFSR